MANDIINEIVDVQISRETLIVDQASFNTAVFFSPSVPFGEQSRNYSSSSAVLQDGFKSKDPAYRAASAYFQQSPRPSQLTIASSAVKDYVLSLTEADIVNNKDYTVTITLADGSTSDFTATASGTAEDDAPTAINTIISTLDTAINGDGTIGAVVTSVVTGTDADAIATLTAASSFYLGSDDVNVAYTTVVNWSDVYSDQETYYDGFYGIGAFSHEEADVLALGAIIEQKSKIYGYSTQGSEALVAKTTPAASGDVLGKMNDLGYDRSFGIYNANADEKYIEMALLGKKLTTVPGSTDWMYSVLPGQVQDSLSLSQAQIVLAKKGNTYQKISGISMIRRGMMSSGEFIDTMRGADDLHSRIQTEVFRKLVTEANGGSKVPMTDLGVQELVAIVETEIRRSINNNYIKESIETQDAGGTTVIIPGYSISNDLVSSLPANQRADRQAPDIRFEAVLTLSIQKVVIRGSLQV